jgi:hypothetical protein
MSRQTSFSRPVGREVPPFEVRHRREKRNAYAACIFVINEGEKVRKQLRDMAAYADQVDLIIADGGSSDGSFDGRILEETRVTALLVKTGPGRLSAQMRMAMAYTMDEGYEGVIVVDGNGKDGMEAIPAFCAKLDAGSDHVQGSRFIPGGRHENTPLSRLLGVRLLHAPLLSLSAGFRYTDTTNGFRGYSRRLILDPRVQPFRDVFSGYELHYYLAIRAARLGLRVCEIPVSRCYPDTGRVPTKIHGLRGNLHVLATLLRAVLHRFDPPAPAAPVT